ncbi:hypothetical protein [Gemella morbillorum]
MLQIKDKLIQKIYSSDLTKCEIIALIELIKISDEEGITNVYYKEMVEAIGCNTATFYNAIRSLQEKGFIEYKKDDKFKKEIVVGICDNNFKYDPYRYVRMDNVFFCEGMYKNLCAGGIKVMLYLLFRVYKQKFTPELNSADHEKNRMFYKNTYRSIADQLGITNLRRLKEYIKVLIKSKMIVLGEHIDVNNRKYDIITVSKSILKNHLEKITEKGKKVEQKVTYKQLHFRNCIKNFCRRNKIEITNRSNLNDTAVLMGQYINQAQKDNKDIYILINTAIKKLKDNILESKNVHFILKALIKKDYNKSVMVY